MIDSDAENGNETKGREREKNRSRAAVKGALVVARRLFAHWASGLRPKPTIEMRHATDSHFEFESYKEKETGGMGMGVTLCSLAWEESSKGISRGDNLSDVFSLLCVDRFASR